MNRAVFKKAQIDAMDAELRTHFLNDNAIRLSKTLGDRVGLTGLGVHLVELPPGKDSTEYHFHHKEDECIYMLSGEVELQLGEGTYQLSAGDFVGHPAGGDPHVMRNRTGTSATYLVIGQRLEYDSVDYPRLKKRLYNNNGTRELVDLDEGDE